ncbi:hypothetical protein BB561_001833 [Smittium simulii]|uniref:TATA box binding protein associated factor (TAF) histone-like fold domain-containing protein n=1 Tax=Smittium simulii TaxID=133385 RepID=A0A2T9YSS2_9FUNG|nr:hypothetical protein BB561_001833 [Smittium simulii]
MYPKNSIKIAAESLGISKLREDDAAKFMRNAKRTKLLVSDVNSALKVRNLQPIYGYDLGAEIKYRGVSAPLEDIFYEEEEEVDLSDIFNEPAPTPPQPVIYSAHWLAIEGVQPSIPQNPSYEQLDLTTPLTVEQPKDKQISISSTSNTAILVKHVLSKEHQLYFECVKESMFSTDNIIQNAALECVATDAGIHQLVPYFIQLVNDTIIQNGPNLPLLKVSVSLVKALLVNPHFYIEPYMHQILPSLLTCLLGKNLCYDYKEDHWTLRDNVAGLVDIINKTYSKSYHSLLQRLARTFTRTFLDPSKPLESHYGAIKGLFTLGSEAIRVLVIPNLKVYSSLLETELESTNPAIKLAAKKCSDLLVISLNKFIISVVKTQPKTNNQDTDIRQDSIEKLNSDLNLTFGEMIADSLIKSPNMENWFKFFAESDR